jgi:hypothetical protein
MEEVSQWGASYFVLIQKMLLGRSNQGEWGGRDMWHAWSRWRTCTGFWCKARRKETTWKTMA